MSARGAKPLNRTSTRTFAFTTGTANSSGTKGSRYSATRFNPVSSSRVHLGWPAAAAGRRHPRLLALRTTRQARRGIRDGLHHPVRRQGEQPVRLRRCAHLSGAIYDSRYKLAVDGVELPVSSSDLRRSRSFEHSCAYPRVGTLEAGLELRGLAEPAPQPGRASGRICSWPASQGREVVVPVAEVQPRRRRQLILPFQRGPHPRLRPTVAERRSRGNRVFRLR
jgi:hypothetical protein